MLQFKTKITCSQKLCDLSFREVVYIPKTITRRHYIENPGSRLNDYANSNMFDAVVRDELRKHNIPDVIDVNNPPDRVNIDKGRFLTTVTIDI